METPSAEASGHFEHGDFLYNGPEGSKEEKDAWCEENVPASGTITIIKEVRGAGDQEYPSDWSFDFLGLGDFTLHQDSDPFSDTFVVGEYSVEEDTPLPDNWKLVGVDCDGHNDATINEDDSVTIDLSEDSDVTCTFTNEYRAPQEPKNEVNLHAQKIVCDNETDLPNWGGANTEVIDADTAADWVAQHESCDLVPWDFEWSYGDVGNPGDNLTTTGGAGWNAFDSGEAVVDVSEVPNNQIRVREIPQEGYIPFTGQNTDQDVSAEMYCTTDTVNYDNWEWISNPESGSDYYCVAWNVPTEPQVEGCTLDLFSDTQDWVEEAGAYAVPTWVHGSWTSIPGATWIWKTEEAENPRDGDTYTFKKMFNWTGGTVLAGDLEIATDNSYEIKLNGSPVASDATIDNFSSSDSHNLSGSVQNGLNTLEVTVENWPWDTDDSHTNPGGLLYHFALEGDARYCGEIVDEEPEDDMCELTIVSDENSLVLEGGPSAATIIKQAILDQYAGAWTASILGAKWIWDNEDAAGTYVRTFEREFEWNGPIDSAILDVASDNSYRVWINNVPVPEEFPGQQNEEYNYAIAHQDQYDVKTFIQDGTNTLKVEVDNWHVVGGALYKLEITGASEDCDPTPEPGMCELTIVSDTTNVVVENGDTPALEIIPVGPWSASIPGATWIWDQKDESDYGVGGPIRTFEKEFEWDGPITSAILDIAADNSYKVWINEERIPQEFSYVNNDWQTNFCDFVGDLVGQQCEEYNYNNQYQDQYDVASYIDQGTNVLKVEVYNWHAYAGALYKLEITGDAESCEPPPQDLPECSDGVDNDQDGNIDMADLGCDNPEDDDDESDDPEQCEAGAGWADEVVESDQGLEKDGDPVKDARSIEESVLGEPEPPTVNPDSGFYSLGFGGSITVKFDQFVENVEGNDLSFHEVTSGRNSYPEELADVEVSQNGVDWEYIGTVSSKDMNGVGLLDFNSTGWSWIRYVRITDVTNPDIHTDGNADGYDIDAIDATWTVCDEPKPQGSDVTVCKYEDSVEGPKLGGWTVWLDEAVEDLFAFVVYDEDKHDYDGVTGEGDALGCVVFENIPYGTYELGEDMEDGWHYVGGDAGTVDIDEPTEEFVLINSEDGGGSNGDGGSITIFKEDVSNTDQKFEFTSDLGGFTLGDNEQEVFSGLSAGEYAFNEIVPQDWSNPVVSCDDDNSGEGESDDLVVILEDDEDVVCTFQNRLPDSPTPSSSTSGGGGTSYRRSGGSSNSGGQVLGAATDFCPFLRDYQHISFQNDPYEVNKAKAFFNAYMSKNLSLNGIFDQDMFSAVVEFQQMFKPDVLDTWASQFAFLDDEPTGYLYQTTRWKINSIMCPGYEAFPTELIPDSRGSSVARAQ